MSVLLLVILSMAVICFIIGLIQRGGPWAPWFTISLGLLLAYVAIPAFLGSH